MTNSEFDQARGMIMDQYLGDSSRTADAASRLLDLWQWLQRKWQVSTFGDFFEQFVILAQPAAEREQTKRDFEDLTRRYGPEPTFADLKEWATERQSSSANSHRENHANG